MWVRDKALAATLMPRAWWRAFMSTSSRFVRYLAAG